MKYLRHLNKYFWKYKFLLLSGIIFITISNIFAIYPASVIRQSLDYVVETVQTRQLLSGFEAGANINQQIVTNVLIFSAVILGMALIKGIFMFFMRQTIIVMSRHIEYDMKNEIFGHYQKLSLSFYKRHNTGDLMNRISEDVSRVRMYVGPAVMYTINLVVLFALVIFTMVRVDARLTLFVLMPLPLLSIALYFVNSAILKKSELIQEKLSAVTTFVQETFSGIRIIKAYNRLGFFAGEFARTSENYRDKNVDLAKFNAIFFPLIMLLIGFSTLMTIYIGGIEVSRGSISPGVIAEFIIYVNMLTWPVASVGWVTSIIQRAAASEKRILEFLQTEPDIKSDTGKVLPVDGKIQLENVNFIYADTGIHALKNINLVIGKGTSLGILGKTGSGKTTLVQLLMRFFDPTEGTIRIDGHDLKTLDLSHLRNRSGYVPQEVFLFSESIFQNIAFGLHEEGDDENLREKVAQAAKDADIYHNIMHFPQQFDTRVGERGITLSGGQKQRISIARAIIKNPDILIFDDCLSAVDTETEENILRNLLRIMQDKTTILVSHRISTLKHADHIIVLDHGHISEEGTHESLLAERGLYYDMYQRQLRENERVEDL